ncbi:PilZ domain-containing protein [Ensifer soli]|uniref:PilZ domain-containing protein n=1 Tax=Ciceribacter sp. sgz301302 TaxID=3342379 RepID=UPI0035B885C0
MTHQIHIADAGPQAATGHYEHFNIERPCRLMIIGDHLKVKRRYNGLLRQISMGGALVDASPALPLPRQFFLEIDGLDLEIGCSTVYRKGSQLGVRFNVPLQQDTLRRLIRLNFKSGRL